MTAKLKMNQSFSHWTSWDKRLTMGRIRLPGIYALALSSKDISATAFSWRFEIVYIGMSNAKGGLKSRLQQFDSTIKGKGKHGGGYRVKFKHPDYGRLTSQLYVSVWPRDCDVTSNTPADLRIMGEVTKHEYDCLALFVEIFGKLPEFNDKKLSRKK